ncbi:MAG: DNA polymerase I [Bacteroidetes bacterium]|nr:DNA polymerase I [Bacteroidota bacterium]
MTEKRLFLLDAMALIYRAYFAYSKNPLVNSKNQNVSAIFGFTNTLMDVLKNAKPTHIGVAFDSQEPTERHKEFAEYKAHRMEIPEAIVFAIPHIRKIIEGFNIPVIIMPGFEADDIIGTLAMQAEKSGFTTLMMTPDKDFGQLVTTSTLLYKPPRMGNEVTVMGVKEICERWEIDDPKKVTDILGLAGDASDNIPGVPGIGEKTAIKLIQQYGSVENLLQNTSSLTGKLKENIEKFSEQALFSKKLATIIRNVPVSFDEEKFRHGEPNRDALKQIFSELEFRRPLERLMGKTESKIIPQKEKEPESGQLSFFTETTHSTFGKGGDGRIDTEPSPLPPATEKETVKSIQHEYHLIDTAEKRKKLIRDLGAAREFCFDTETTGLNPHECEIVAIAFAVRPHEAFFIPLPEEMEETMKILGEFREIFQDPAIRKIGQNIKFDLAVLGRYGIHCAGELFDTMVAHYLILPGAPHNMDDMAAAYLNYSPVPIEALIGKKGKKQGSMRNVPVEKIAEYTCEDADITLQLKIIFEKMLHEQGLVKLFNETEMPLIYVLAAMEKEGIRLDTDTLKKYSSELDEEIIRIEKDIHQIAGRRFNIASPKQLADVLYNHLKITDKPKKTEKGQFSTREDVLQQLAAKHPVVPLILDIRELQKLKSTYVDAFPELISKTSGRIHTTFNQAVAVTGRLSSDNPNLQNIPIRTAKGREVRKAFVPRDEDHLLLSADYSQIELRIMAELSGDGALIAAFKEGQDIHASTASKIFGVEISGVTPEMRRKAKTVNFGIIYGISAFGLSERLGIPRREAAEIIGQYFTKYPNVKNYMEITVASCREHGYVETLMGRKRFLPDIQSQNAVVRGMAERNAINMPIQGTAADMIKVAMIIIYAQLEKNRFRSKMVLQVHDELVFDMHREEEVDLRGIVEDAMKNAIPMKVPIEVDINTGENWLKAH